eukprot:GHVT01063529.1.p1 GENE.GHVT01063529.1~~GHVT01063529.1.p1  ORF type:complete len:722 (-),score=167.84 GHVT01063529.1:75-2240(-)
MPGPLRRVVAHLDVDCFYCQVEHRRLNIPRHEPLAVQQWRNVVAVNYPARAFGVCRGDSAEVCRRKCPHIKLVHVDLYRPQGPPQQQQPQQPQQPRQQTCPQQPQQQQQQQKQLEQPHPQQEVPPAPLRPPSETELRAAATPLAALSGDLPTSPLPTAVSASAPPPIQVPAGVCFPVGPSPSCASVGSAVSFSCGGGRAEGACDRLSSPVACASRAAFPPGPRVACDDLAEACPSVGSLSASSGEALKMPGGQTTSPPVACRPVAAAPPARGISPSSVEAAGEATGQRQVRGRSSQSSDAELEPARKRRAQSLLGADCKENEARGGGAVCHSASPTVQDPNETAAVGVAHSPGEIEEGSSPQAVRSEGQGDWWTGTPSHEDEGPSWLDTSFSPGDSNALENQKNARASLEVYRKASFEIFKILDSQCDLLQRTSIDECFIDLTQQVHATLRSSNQEQSLRASLLKSFPELCVEATLAVVAKTVNGSIMTLDEASEDDYFLLAGSVLVYRLRSSVFRATAISLSAGVSHNKMLAKLSSACYKPDQQTIVRRQDVPLLLQKIPINKIKGLGGKRGQELSQKMPHVKHLTDLSAVPKAALLGAFGAQFGTWLCRAREGHDDEPVKANIKSKSMLAFKAFSTGEPRAAVVEQWLDALAQQLLDRLLVERVRAHRWPKTLTVYHSSGPSGGSSGQRTRQCPLPSGRPTPTAEPPSRNKAGSDSYSR